MIKVCAIFASPNKNGITAAVLNSFINKLDNVQIDTFDAFDLAAKPCIGCGACKKEERCIYRDLNTLFESLENSDLLIVASPVYCLSVPAPLKAIVDRFQRYYNARFSLGKRPAIEKSRRAVLLMTAGSDRESGDVVVKQLERCFSVMNTKIATSVMLNNTDDHYYSDDEIEKAAAFALSQLY